MLASDVERLLAYLLAHQTDDWMIVIAGKKEANSVEKVHGCDSNLTTVEYAECAASLIAMIDERCGDWVTMLEAALSAQSIVDLESGRN